MRPDVARLRGLYAITAHHHPVMAVLQGGVRLVQYRNKSPDRTQAAALLKLCHRFGATLIVNDSVTLAADIGADGVHLGRDDPYYTDLSQARALLGPKRLIGVSCYNDLNLAQTAVDAGADYIALGSIFASPTKPDACRVSLEILREARQRFHVPIVAIGGITLENAPDVLDTGVDVLAVSSGLFNATNLSEQAEKFQRLFKDTQP